MLDQLAVAKLSVPAIQRVIETIARSREGAGRIPKNASHLLPYLGRVFAWGVQHGHCSHNPVTGTAGRGLADDRRGHVGYRFDRARERAGFPKDQFQFRDLRAKAGTDKTDSAGDVRQAPQQLGHQSVTTTEI